MTTVIVIGLLIAVALIGLQVLWDWRRSGRLWCGPLPPPCRNRESQEGIWRERDGHDMLADIDALLTLLCNAFAFNPDDRFKFAPDDQVMDIYRGCYPRWAFWLVGNSMEIETMMTGLKDQFGIESDQWFADPSTQLLILSGWLDVAELQHVHDQMFALVSTSALSEAVTARLFRAGRMFQGSLGLATTFRS